MKEKKDRQDKNFGAVDAKENKLRELKDEDLEDVMGGLSIPTIPKVVKLNDSMNNDSMNWGGKAAPWTRRK